MFSSPNNHNSYIAQAAESTAKSYESHPSWISWEVHYLNNHPDLVAGLNSWIPFYNHFNFYDFSVTNYSVPTLEAAGRLHFVLFGYEERRNVNFYYHQDTTAPAQPEITTTTSRVILHQQ